MPRADGSAPIGWKNLFSCSFWKKVCKRFKRLKKNVTLAVPGEELFSVEDISKTYSGSIVTHALQDVTFSVSTGEIIILIGPNGCGKSTLINSMTGTIQANSGNLRLFGTEASDFAEIQEFIGICYQENVFFPLMTVEEHLNLFSELRGAPRDVIASNKALFRDQFELGQSFQTRAGDLSGGQKRKLCIALALIGEPPIAILDEPTAGIDATSRASIWKAVADFKRTTIFVSSHALEEAESISSRLFVMANGKLLYTGAAADLRQQFHCGYIFKGVGEHSDINMTLNVIKEAIPDASLMENRENTIVMPSGNPEKITEAMESIDRYLGELKLSGYTLNAESVENVILRLVSST